MGAAGATETADATGKAGALVAAVPPIPPVFPEDKDGEDEDCDDEAANTTGAGRLSCLACCVIWLTTCPSAKNDCTTASVFPNRASPLPVPLLPLPLPLPLPPPLPPPPPSPPPQSPRKSPIIPNPPSMPPPSPARPPSPQLNKLSLMALASLSWTLVLFIIAKAMLDSSSIIGDSPPLP